MNLFDTNQERKISSAYLFLTFFRLGLTSFGGPAAHIAIMEEEFVRRKRWLTKDEFLNLLGLVHLIPGPNSTELAILIGKRLLGTKGLILAGLGFIIPAMTIVWVIAATYHKVHEFPIWNAIMKGIYPVVFSIILNALKSLLPSSIRSVRHFLLWFGSLAIYLLGFGEVSTLLTCGTTEMILNKSPSKNSIKLGIIFVMAILFIQFASRFGWNLHSFDERGDPNAASIFAYFLKLGSIIYGSGYVLMTYLQNDLVNQAHWIKSADLLDAISIGQFTPGPVFTTATFLGYLLGGHMGAWVATLGIFLPSFVLVSISDGILKFIQDSPSANTFLRGINIASLSLLASVLIKIAPATLDSWLSFVMMIISFTLLQFKVPSALLILLGSSIGFGAF